LENDKEDRLAVLRSSDEPDCRDALCVFARSARVDLRFAARSDSIAFTEGARAARGVCSAAEVSMSPPLPLPDRRSALLFVRASDRVVISAEGCCAGAGSGLERLEFHPAEGR
jgi:hypothetical protein